jgi:hypothetical protein
MGYILRAFALAALLLSGSSAYAIPITFTALLSGASEVPPTGSPGTGLATVVLDPTAHSLQISGSFAGLGSPTIAAHLHCCVPVWRQCDPCHDGTLVGRVPPRSDIGHFLFSDLRSQAVDCYSACNFGSDSILMKFGLCLVLVHRESTSCSKPSNRPPWSRSDLWWRTPPTMARPR